MENNQFDKLINWMKEYDRVNSTSITDKIKCQIASNKPVYNKDSGVKAPMQIGKGECLYCDAKGCSDCDWTGYECQF